MRYGPGHKEETKARILGAVGRGFRRLGFGGIGVDGLAKEAGVTSGAFYGHFPSKAEAFKAAAVAGLVELREAIESLRAEDGDAWLKKFTDFYMNVRRTCQPDESCALQSLTPEVARADDETKAAYEAELLRVVDAFAEGLPDGTLLQRRKAAWAALSILSGGVTLARAVDDPKIGSIIAASVRDVVLAIYRQK
jgi:TetR/AcrR family transcriptional regulator, transcriptional repressor for nem operon